jgi:hypothetical protein
MAKNIAIYTKWTKNIAKYTKWTKNSKIYQMAIKYVYELVAVEYSNGLQNTNNFHSKRPSKIYPNRDFWYANICTIWQPWLMGGQRLQKAIS